MAATFIFLGQEKGAGFVKLEPEFRGATHATLRGSRHVAGLCTIETAEKRGHFELGAICLEMSSSVIFLVLRVHLPVRLFFFSWLVGGFTASTPPGHRAEPAFLYLNLILVD